MDDMVGRFLLFVPLAGVAIVAATGLVMGLSWCVRKIGAALYPVKKGHEDLHESLRAKRSE